MDEEDIDRLIALQEELLEFRNKILADIVKMPLEQKAETLPDFLVAEKDFMHLYMCEPIIETQKLKEILDLEASFELPSPEVND
jgi:hypothetical protein